MPTVFEVLGGDHLEIKRMLAELESGPTALTGASDSQLGLRKKMVEELIIEESEHEALEEMYFWPACGTCLPDGRPARRHRLTTRNRKARKSLTCWTS